MSEQEKELEQKHIDTVQSINDLIGMEDLKQFALDSIVYARELKKHSSYPCFRALNYLVSIDAGCGMSTMAIKMTLLGNYMGAYSTTYYFEYILSDETRGERITIKDLYETLFNKDNNGKLMVLDISEYMTNDKLIELKKLLIDLEHLAQKFNFIFRVPYLEPRELKRIQEFLSDVMLLRTFVVPPYTDAQLHDFAQRRFSSYGFELSEEGWNVFDARIREEKCDGRFYGLRTTDKVVNEFILKKHLNGYFKENNRKGNSSSIVESDVASLSTTYGLENAEKDPFEEMDELVGMESVTTKLKEIVAQLELSKNNSNIDRPSMHMRFVGSPGTGKTTVARILGKILAQKGLLSKGNFFEYAGRDLCGQYVGQTAPRTLSICRDAYGSVLFIDEAYSLYRSEHDITDYGQEAITALIAEMENHRDNLVVIMAGYQKPMEVLMHGNEGLRSRMPFVIEFPSYSKDVLATIFMKIARKHFTCDEELEPLVKEYFNSLSDAFIQSEEFSNARYVRNLYERTWSKTAMRMQLSGDKGEFILKPEDFKLASSEPEFKENLIPARRRVGY